MPSATNEQAAALALLEDVIRKAKAAGADAADAVMFDSASLSLSQRLGKTEKLERSESGDLGLRVFIGRRQAIVSSSDRQIRALDELVERAVAMARVVPEDPFAGLADPDQLVRDYPDMDLLDPVEPSPESLIERASRAEDAARSITGVTNSEGADASWSRSDVAVAASNGFSGAYSVSRQSLAVSVLAGTGTGMERGYDYDSKVHGSDLRAADLIGHEAGERAVRQLNARKVKSCKVPVIFDPRVSQSLVGHLIGAINGAAIARGTSFLKDKMGERIFADGISIIDDPHVRRGLRSRPFDGEGLATRRHIIIDDGRLTTWLLDLRSARQLGLKSTGHASRGTSGPPGAAPANVHLAPGRISRADLLAGVEDGLYVTQMMGSAVNGVTGDYSRGASGFWIEKGQIAWPVNELTIAGNLKDMFLNMTPADDLVLRYGMDAPTLRIDGLTIAGQ